MNTNLRKTIIAGSIAALIALPVWAASDAPKETLIYSAHPAHRSPCL